MMQITPQMRILLAVEPADFRRGIDGLARICRAELSADPFSGIVFVFRNRRATALKILVVRRQGLLALPEATVDGTFLVVAGESGREIAPPRRARDPASAVERESRRGPGFAAVEACHAKGRGRRVAIFGIAGEKGLAFQQDRRYRRLVTDEILGFRGRVITAADIAFLRGLIAAHPTASRRALSQQLCEAWNWLQPNGRSRDMVCRGLMLQLHRRGPDPACPPHP